MSLSMRNSLAKHVDFGFLKDAFPNPRELPVNIDMIMEKNHYFIIGEWKKPGEIISNGQEIMLKRLANIDKIKVLIITGNSDDMECYIDKVEQLYADGNKKLLGKGIEFFKALMSEWHKYATQGKL
jgi:hypothetical protein